MNESYEIVNLPLKGINGNKLIYRETKKLKELSQQFKLLALENMRVDLSDTDAVLLEAYYTATIEGARTTLEKVKAGRNKKDERMVRNCNTAIKEISDIPLNLNSMVRMWRVISDGVCENTSAQGSVFRDKMVYIGNEERVVHTPMNADDIEPAMESMFYYYELAPMNQKIIKSIIMQFYIGYMHPMCDGNGRLARLVTIWSLYESGLHFMRFMPVSKMINQNLKKYYNAFIESEKVIEVAGVRCIDLSPFIEFMFEVFIKSVEEMNIRMSHELTELQKFILTKMSEHGINAELSTTKCAIILGLPEDLACLEMNKLAEAGYLERYGNVFRLKISL